MSATKKPRADSPLKTLPDERQAEIFEYLRGHTIADTRKWLRADGLSVGSTALSQFGAWYRTTQRLNRHASTVSVVLERLKQNDPNLSVEKLEEAGQIFFSALAIDEEDSLTWKRIQDSKTRKETLKFLRQKFAEDQKSKIEAGLDELAEMLKQHPDLMKEFQTWRGKFTARVTKA